MVVGRTADAYGSGALLRLGCQACMALHEQGKPFFLEKNIFEGIQVYDFCREEESVFSRQRVHMMILLCWHFLGAPYIVYQVKEVAARDCWDLG